MPITFNHSNIGVQYSTGSNYIIETVKSDLYRRNEIVDTIVRDNIQTAPVTPIISIQEGSNVYAVESYTYSGTANTADYTRVFPKSTTCDILIVGGGGAGGTYIGGGGGGGGVLHIENATISAGTYNIQVGKGGTGVTGGASGTTAQNGSSSKAFGIEVFGGGYGGVGQWGTSAVQQAGANGGSGGGGGSCYTGTAVLGGTVIQPSFTSSVITANNYTYYGGNGASGLLFNNNSYGAIGANGGGGAGGNAPANTDQLNAGAGADGIAINITGTSYFWGGGGGGGLYGGTYNGKAGNGGKGGGGGGSGSQVADQVGIGGIGGITLGQDGDLEGDGTPTAGNGGDGTGGGGGGCGRTTASPNAVSGKGGSGIVIIRYLLGTIPANNLLTNANEPIITSPTFTETVRSFTHSGGTETQTTHTITIGQNTICDILIVGGGGGGGDPHGGGGGAGQLVFIHQATLNGTYTIKVGKGGIGGVFVSTAATKGSNSEFGNVIAEGGGANGGTNVENKNGGSGAGGDGYTTNGGTAGAGTKNNIVDTFQGAIVYSKGNNGGDERLSDARGGGGGGSGMSGDTGANGGKGGNGLSGISEISYDFKTNFGTNVGKLESDNLIYFAGGGGGGNSTTGVNNGSKGGGGSGGLGDVGPNNIGVNATENTGSGGGGGGANSSAYGGNGGSGIVIIKFKSITSAGILDGITHKRLNFNYINSNDNLIFYYRIDESPFSWLEAYNEAIINGRRLPTITELRTYMTNYPSIVAPFNGLDIWSAVVNPAVANSKDWVQVGNNPHTRGKSHTQDLGVYPSWGDNTTETFARVYWDVVDLNQLRYDFTPYNTEATWKSYAATIPNFTYSLDTFLITFDPDAVWTGYSVVGWVQMTLPSGYNFLTITYGLGVQGTEDVRLLINGVLKSSATTTNRLITYSQAYNVGDVVRIEETFSTMNANFIFQFTNIYPYQYTINFPVPTIADINNNSNIVLRGAYDIALSTSNALIIPKEGQHIHNPSVLIRDSSERIYPPVRNFTSDTAIISGQLYGNGTYIVSASTFFIGEETFRVFNGTNSGWTQSTAKYDGSPAGTYTGLLSLGGFTGEWIKVQFPVSIKLTRYIIEASSIGGVNRAPSVYKIFGSNNNIDWEQVVYKSVPLVSADYISSKYEEKVSSNNYYRFFALVIGKNMGLDSWLGIGEWYIYGKEFSNNSLSIRYNILNPILDPIGAQWTYSSSNTNVYHMGSVGIGTTRPEYQLDVRGAIYSSVGGYTQTGLTTWTVTSDKRIKDNIVRASYDKCLENVKNIELYNFNFKNNCINTNDKHQLGFIAQEVQQVYPKAVEVGKIILNTNEAIDDILTLNTTQIDYTLYGAVKNLIEKIEDIDNDLENIEKAVGMGEPLGETAPTRLSRRNTFLQDGINR